jgi:hypothetical protein
MKFEDKNMEKSINLLAESRKAGRKEAIDEVLKLISNIDNWPENFEQSIADWMIEEVEKLKE